MRLPLCGGAVVIAVALLALDGGRRQPSVDDEEVRLDRLTSDAVLGDPLPESRPSGSVRYDIPLTGGRTHLIVDATLNGVVHGPMLVDTGASYCVVTRRTARKLGLAARSRRTIPVATANGRIDAGVVAIAAVELQGARLADVDAVVMDAVEPPFIGIIGLNFLTRFRVSIDSREKLMRLEPWTVSLR